MKLFRSHGGGGLEVSRHQLANAGEIRVALLVELFQDGRVDSALLGCGIRDVVVALPRKPLRFALDVLELVHVLLAGVMESAGGAALALHAEHLEGTAEELLDGEVDAPHWRALDLLKLPAVRCIRGHHPRAAVQVDLVRRLRAVLNVSEGLRIGVQGARDEPPPPRVKEKGPACVEGVQALVGGAALEGLLQADVAPQAIRRQSAVQGGALRVAARTDESEDLVEALPGEDALLRALHAKAEPLLPEAAAAV
mmetsp:Transcript_112486/g.314321  ORF Transcript_112486/g.314321 Transcript_112486/m.314321 type:complete len:253 (+) Transcript_112486:3928-4686(+)